MFKLKTITGIGRCRILFEFHNGVVREYLLRATTGEYIHRIGTTEIILPDIDAAFEWARSRGLCSSLREFISRGVETMRIPYHKVDPQPRLFNQAIRTKRDRSSRIYELIQHPVYCICVVRHSGTEEVIRLNSDQRNEVVRMVSVIVDTEYYSSERVTFDDDNVIHWADSRRFREVSNIQLGFDNFIMETFFVHTGADLPPDFLNRNGDEATWLRVEDEVWSGETLSKLVCIAVTLNLHFQLNIEGCLHQGEDPFDLLTEFPY